MDTSPPNPPTDATPERRRPTWAGPTAAVGALAALVVAAFRLRTPAGKSQVSAPAGSAGANAPAPQAGAGANVAGGSVATAPAQSLRSFARHYSRVMAIGGERSADPFRRSLDGIAVAGKDDFIYALGDSEIRVFDTSGRRVRGWKVVERAACLTVAPDGRVIVGAGDRLHVYDAGGQAIASFTAGPADRPTRITAVKVHGDAILAADGWARVVRRLDASGKEVAVIGNRNKTNGFMLPNKSLDIGVDARGVVYATDTGRHQVTSWTLDGEPVGKFGRFGMTNPEDFVGCCNPVNIAVLPDGTVVVGEKVAARVKVFAPDTTLLAVIGPGEFDPLCTFIHVAVDSKGRIVTADPVRREIKVFAS